MKRYDYADLSAIAQRCASASAEDPRVILQWIDEVGIDGDAFAEFAEMTARAAGIAARLAMADGVTPEQFLAAIFSAGFEMGVRFQEDRGVSI